MDYILYYNEKNEYVIHFKVVNLILYGLYSLLVMEEMKAFDKRAS